MATFHRNAPAVWSCVRDAKGEGLERGVSQIRILGADGAELSDAELEQVSAGGGRVDPGGANN